MKFVKYEMSAGYCGTDKTVYAKFDDKTTDDEIANIGEQIAWDHADSYGAVEEWEKENPEIEFELDYSWSYITEKEYDEADASEKEDYTPTED
jgi:hypothetical protein